MSVIDVPLVTVGKTGQIFRKERPINRFLGLVHMPQLGGCWSWTGSLTPQGYGHFSRGGRAAKTIGAHVWAYTYWVGPVPEGLQLDHLCRNRQCVNPGHLEPVTHRENGLRGTGIGARNAAKTHCVKGHPFVGRNSEGTRFCGQCKAGKVYPF